VVDEPDQVARAREGAGRAKAQEVAAHRHAEKLHAEALREQAEADEWKLHAEALRQQAEADGRVTGQDDR